ncbi:MAG: putative toxin-antitoxin system toxin component, PIN family [Ruminococcus sp.]|jgi:putative PIN family toxin of toxin-antitoxin system|nr:putative toxin-antitoxin system toxin component, PIN family [Ruminococcus sp.]
MDILIDTNIIISAGIFPNERIIRFLNNVALNHNLFICSYSLEEVVNVTNRKFPNRIKILENLLENLDYTIIFSPLDERAKSILGDISIRDKNDQPILASVIAADVDILITGDKDFHCLEIERPEILTVSEFMDKYYGE